MATQYSIDKLSIVEDITSSDEEEIPTKKTKPVKHKYGEYNNVLLTDEELDKLKTEYSDYQERIERLSSYVASTGKSYKSHYATIRNWARKDDEKPKQQVKQTSFNSYSQRNYEGQALERMLLDRNKSKKVDDDPELKAEADALKKMLQKKYEVNYEG
jgi:Asp-tRNA(Asn)/Glu-tRNA(Gln) amidotransferase C subunit